MKIFGNYIIQMHVLAAYFNMFFLKNVILRQFLTIKNGSFYLINKKNLLETLYFFKHSFLNAQKFLLDIIVVDNGCKKKRFLIVFVLCNCELGTKTNICTYVDDGDELETICKLYCSSEWLEQEAWDSMGIDFSSKNKKRILSDYSARGHFLRKNFPRSGFYESKKKENVKINTKKKTETIQKKFRKIKAYI